MTFPGIARSNINKFWSLFICTMGTPSCISNIEEELSWYVIRLSWNCPNEISFDLYYGTKATLSSLIFHLFVRLICTISMLSDWMIWPLMVVKSQVFGSIFSMKKFRLLVRCHDMQESKYYINLVFNIIFDFAVISVFLRQNGLRLELSFLSLMVAIFVFYYWWLRGLGLSELSRSWSCLILPVFFFLNNL